MNIELTGKVLWITGGGEGIGRGVALLAAECGAKVAVTAYACSKGAQLVLGQMLALELAPSRIRVNVICPGAIESNIHEKTERQDLEGLGVPVEFPEGKIPLTNGQMGTPEQVAQLAVFLTSDLADHITGTPVWIDGAQSLLQG